MSKTFVAGLALLSIAAALYGQRVIFSDDMSSFPSGWTLGADGLHQDTWTLKTNRWYSSGASAKCTRHDTPYSDSSNCWMQRAVSLSGQPMGVITFWAWQRTEGGYDSLCFEYSSDGGSTWNTLWSRTGYYASWRRITLSNIPPATNLVRFRFSSDASGNEEGVYLDDVVLYGMDTTGTTVWFDDMTDFPNRWELRDPHSRFWGNQSYRYYSPAYAAQCADRDTGYYDDMASRATRVISLRGSGYNALSFQLYLDAEEDYDYLDAEYHTLGGWLRLGRYTGTAGWRAYNYELPGNADSVRFYFHSDDGTTQQGAYVDDALVSDFGVRALDAAAVSIASPPADMDSGATAPVTALIRNNGAAKVSVPVYFSIGDGSSYRALAMVDSIAAGGAATVTFPSWTADVRPGIYPCKCSTAYFLDNQTANDMVVDSVTVANRDAGVVSILAPVGLVPVAAVTPRAVVRNHGNARELVDVTFTIPTAGYANTVSLPAGLPVRTDTTLEFAPWNPVRGIYAGQCSTHLTGDRVKANDVLAAQCMVGETGWTAMAGPPPGPKGKRVKDGGCLAYLGPSDLSDLSDTSYIYALKGNSTCEFYRYNAADNVWSARESIPPVGASGRKKMVKKGACITRQSGALYAAKGGNTLEFWKYALGSPGYPWQQLSDIPAGARNVREGAGAAPVKIGAVPYVYFLKGSSTWEFYRYNTAANTWEPQADAPPGLSGKSFKNGSCLVYDSMSNVIYALKGSYNELFRYDVGANTWSSRTSLPLIGASGKKKKVKDGAGMALAGALIYALKGGNTREFWVYQPGTDQWFQSSDLLLGAGKNVKGGGAIAYVPEFDALYATKGNNTLEFYKYQLSGKCEVRSMNYEVQSSSFIPHNFDFRLQIAPNPFSGAATITYSLPQAGNVSLKLYDVTGTLVTTLSQGHANAGVYTTSIDASTLARGIYLLKFESDGNTTTSKLIVE
jgi:N-acetylneuraminic acid mutarotase